MAKLTYTSAEVQEILDKANELPELEGTNSYATVEDIQSAIQTAIDGAIGGELLMANKHTTLKELFKDIADAIREKTGSSEDIVADDFPEEIAAIPTGGGSKFVPSKDVDFIDYDGTIVYSYTVDEFLALTEMPANPTHDGLVAQGWNWEQNDAQEYVEKYGMLVIGQMYITDDEHTRIYIYIEKPDTTINLMFVTPSAKRKVYIDWGDGQERQTVTLPTANEETPIPHQYEKDGYYCISFYSNYVIYIGSEEGTLLCGPDTSLTYEENIPYSKAVLKIEMGTKVGFNKGSCQLLVNLKAITLPKTMSLKADLWVDDCISLSGLVLPSGTSLGASLYDSGVAYVAIQKRKQTMGEKAAHAHSLRKLTLPEITSEGSAWGTFSAKFASALQNVVIPEGYTYIQENAFADSWLVSEVRLPETITSIGKSAFGDSSIKEITIPKNVTSIGENAFVNTLFQEAHVKPTTPPTLGYFAFPRDCAIYVPQGSLSAYKAATNWSQYADNMVEESV